MERDQTQISLNMLAIVRQLKTQFDRIEEKMDRSYRKNNVIIFGLEPTDHEVPGTEEYTWCVLKALWQLLDIVIPKSEVVRMRTLQRDYDAHPPIVIEFSSYGQKIQVLENRYKLNGSGVLIFHDLTYNQRRTLRRIRRLSVAARKRNISAYERGWRLYLEGVPYGMYKPGDVRRAKQILRTRSQGMGYSDVESDESDNEWNRIDSSDSDGEKSLIGVSCEKFRRGGIGRRNRRVRNKRKMDARNAEDGSKRIKIIEADFSDEIVDLRKTILEKKSTVDNDYL